MRTALLYGERVSLHLGCLPSSRRPPLRHVLSPSERQFLQRRRPGGVSPDRRKNTTQRAGSTLGEILYTLVYQASVFLLTRTDIKCPNSVVQEKEQEHIPYSTARAGAPEPRTRAAMRTLLLIEAQRSPARCGWLGKDTAVACTWL